ncbi:MULTISPECIES: hypothetical protein [unclassified Dysgonomonas]|jgi:hypothetical protein|uniref:hypothetical protein n=1 Tax=unclassified Dysgonomonas TaxID=2630389 RepID=UPI0025C12B5C|nr:MULTISPECIES: hypothetical protein [unclassified Dysgonomonas]MDR2002040.1 DUF5034 domain-containing protein [Prevotella sp.]HMM02753.1 hypothetical protein [Dysgonomonas sp.]
MKKLSTLYSALLLFGVTGCTYIEPPGPFSVPANEKSYIQGFFELEDIHVSPISGVKIDKKKKIVNLMSTSFDAPKIYEITDGIGVVINIGVEGIGKGLIDWGKNNLYVNYYYELVEKIGDTSFNSETVHRYGYDMYANADTLRSINIICDKSLDEVHPAGSSLNDIFSIYVKDPYAIVKNGYKSVTGLNYYSLDGGTPEGYPLSLFGSQLSSVNLIEKPYIGTKLYLVLDTIPEHTDEYTFTVFVTNKQGKTIEKTTEPVRIKGAD